MSESGIEPLKVEKPETIREALNEDALKGVLVDGVALSISEHIVMFEGIISQPRSEKDVVAVRMIVPVEALPDIQKGIEEVIQYFRKEFNKDLRGKK